MAKNTVYVRNHRKRVYNGIRYMQIAEIPESLLPQYLLSWFLEFDPKSGKSKGSDAGPWEVDIDPPVIEHNVDEAKQFLEKHNIKYAQNMKEENIIKRALENWWKTTPQSTEVSSNDLSALDEPDDEESELDVLKGMS